MKSHVLIAALALPLAFVAGRMGGVNADEVNPVAPKPAASPAKSATRSAETRRNSGKGRSPAWTILRKRAALTADELIDELFAAPQGGSGNSWALDHLLATDPERLFREIYRCREGGLLAEATRRWSMCDPGRALPLLLGDEEPFAWRGREFYDPHPPVLFTGVGMKDPEQGLAMIDALPPGKRDVEYYASLLEGIAGTSPEKVGGYFERIVAKGDIPEREMPRMLNGFAAADPQAALAWAKGQGDPVPEKFMGPLLEGLSKGDVTLAARLYEEAAVKPAGIMVVNSIGARLGRSNPDLGATWSWFERTSNPAQLEAHKSNALLLWARRHPEAAAERVLAQPDLALGDSNRSYQIAALFKSLGKEEEFLARADQLPPEQAEALKQAMARVGTPAVPPPPPTGTGPSLQEIFVLMRKDPQKGEESWRSLEEEQRQQFAAQMAKSGGEFHDPALALKLLVEAKADLSSQGARAGLARLSLMDPEAAARIAEQAPAGEGRSSIVEAIYRNWSVDDLPAATAWRDRVTAGQPAKEDE